MGVTGRRLFMVSSLSVKKYCGVIAVVLVLFCVSCRQTPLNSTISADDNGGYASDASKIEFVNDDVISIADAAGSFYNGAYMRTTAIGNCAIVATDTISAVHNIIIRYGDYSDCICLDGRKRRGNIIVTYLGRYNDTGTEHIIRFDNYFIDDVQLTGTLKVTRIDTTVLGNWYYKETVNDSLLITPDQYIVWQGSLVRKWISGYNTGDRSDDAFSISGVATLTRPDFHQYTFSIASPLQINMNWNYCVAGSVNVNGLEGPRVLNYGSGTLDKLAQINIGATPYQIVLSY
jgi:hypothetical protein